MSQLQNLLADRRVLQAFLLQAGTVFAMQIEKVIPCTIVTTPQRILSQGLLKHGPFGLVTLFFQLFDLFTESLELLKQLQRAECMVSQLIGQGQRALLGKIG